MNLKTILILPNFHINSYMKRWSLGVGLTLAVLGIGGD